MRYVRSIVLHLGLQFGKNNKQEEFLFSNLFENFTKLKYTNICIKNILSHESKNLEVKNGAVTLCDRVFIDEDLKKINSKYIVNIIKCSTSKKSKCLFPL